MEKSTGITLRLRWSAFKSPVSSKVLISSVTKIDPRGSQLQPEMYLEHTMREEEVSPENIALHQCCENYDSEVGLFEIASFSARSHLVELVQAYQTT